MEAFVLTVQLFTGAPIVQIPVSDCEMGVVWLEAAWEWADRSSVQKIGGPMYTCEPAPAMLFRAHR